MPDWKSHLRPRLAALRHSPAREAEIAEELAQHLEDRWQELVARGATPQEAEHLARTEFDGARLEALLGTLRQSRWRETPPPGPSHAFSLDSMNVGYGFTIQEWKPRQRRLVWAVPPLSGERYVQDERTRRVGVVAAAIRGRLGTVSDLPGLVPVGLG